VSWQLVGAALQSSVEPKEKGTRHMDDQPTGKRCPKCDSTNYEFRGRKKFALEPGETGGGSVETKSRCKACGHVWGVRTPQRADPTGRG